MNSIDFLLNVWKHTCQDGDYVFLSTKKSGWKDHALPYGRGIKRGLVRFFRQYPADQYDIYFCPLPFKGQKRQKGLVKSINTLWSDIDEGNPKIPPTILWESSPGRLQGLWFLSDTLNPEDGSDLNKALTYYMDADKGGWDITQVLRVPGTKNHKYDRLPTVRILEEDFERVYSSSRLSRRIGMKNKEPELKSDSLAFEQVYSKYRRQIPAKVRRLLLQKHVTEGKRSDIIWYLENKLSEAGLSPDEIITLVKHSAWNKYKGRSDEDVRLRTELEKIVETTALSKNEDQVEKQVDEELSTELRIDTFFDIMSSLDSAPGWLIEGFWMNKSHGIIAGEPKSFKSTLALDMGISVASGKDFLGRFPVHRQGKVLYIQNENATWIMKDRIEKIIHSKGLVGSVKSRGSRISGTWPENLQFYTVNQQSFLLTDPVHQRLLEQALAFYRPELVILDPLYLMFDGDVNSAQELNPILSWLMDLRYKYNCALVVIHHYNKGGTETKRGGQRMLGSTTLHGWIESAWYINTEVNEDFENSIDSEAVNSENAKAQITIGREFRGAGLYPRIDLNLEMGGFSDPTYKIQMEVHRDSKKVSRSASPEEIEKEVLGIIERSKNPVKESQLKKNTGLDLKMIRSAVDKLCDRGKVSRTKEGIKLLL